jgi:adenylate cyclase
MCAFTCLAVVTIGTVLLTHLKDIPTPGENGRRSSEQHSSKSAPRSHHKLHMRLPGHNHRHRNSKEDNNPAEPRNDISQPYSLRPVTSREDSTYSIRQGSQYTSALSSALNSKTNLSARPSSPTPSAFSEMTRDTVVAQRSPSTTKSHGLFARLRGKDKDKKDRSAPPDSLKSLGVTGNTSVTSLNPSINSAKFARAEPSPQSQTSRPNAQNGTADKMPTKDARRGHHARLPTFRKEKRVPTNELPPVGRDPNEAITSNASNDAVFFLDRDLNNMEGIVNTQHPPMTPPIGELQKQPTFPGDELPNPAALEDDAAWDAPDSWAVKRTREDGSLYGEVDENGEPIEEQSDTKTYCLRIFRVDSTFATLSATLNTTVQEIIQILGKKTVLQDELDNYHIVMRKHDTSRQLESNERPLLIQKRLLEQAGYSDLDRLEDVGGKTKVTSAGSHSYQRR